MKNSFLRFIVYTGIVLLVSMFLGVGIIALELFGNILEVFPQAFWLLPFLIIVFYAAGYYAFKEYVDDKEREMNAKIRQVESEKQSEEKNRKEAEYKLDVFKKTLKERTSGFPTLFSNIEYFEELIDNHTSNYLATKSHPAQKASEVVKEEAKRRRVAEKQYRRISALIEYYEQIAPFLLDFKDEIIDDDDEFLRDYTEEEKQDPITHYLTKEEYRKLSPLEKNQMALDRFWKRSKSKWLIGRLYERYVGYLFETEGYDVKYVGIIEGKEDLGRDLICTKGGEVIIIQCKNWSKFKTVYEKHIFQFFGTVFKYRDENKDKKVKAIFYCTTKLSDLARRFAKELDIDLVENHKFDQGYACIKCNISMVDGSKIYHLPFDQQYDNTKIELNRGEFYAKTVKEAEAKGFRRAWRWRGTSKD